MPTEDQRWLARRFLEVVPPLLHRLGSELRGLEEPSGPVTFQQFRAMTTLHRATCSLGDLAARHEVSSPAMSRLISTLVARGWVLRAQDPTDRRQVTLTLTAEGETRWQAMVAHSVEHLATLLGAMTEEEAAALAAALAGLGRVARERAGLKE